MRRISSFHQEAKKKASLLLRRVEKEEKRNLRSNTMRVTLLPHESPMSQLAEVSERRKMECKCQEGNSEDKSLIKVASVRHKNEEKKERLRGRKKCVILSVALGTNARETAGLNVRRRLQSSRRTIWLHINIISPS